MSQDSEEVKVTSREEREAIGRQINAGFAKVERTETSQEETNIPTHEVAPKMSEDKIRELLGEGNYEASKHSDQHNSTNS